ncbi:MAG: hypothetical protein IKL53_08190 [Lachnospiraceae bacterium]|nr:hypothetical protein [Lachnospiraceae bacterium]
MHKTFYLFIYGSPDSQVYSHRIRRELDLIYESDIIASNLLAMVKKKMDDGYVVKVITLRDKHDSRVEKPGTIMSYKMGLPIAYITVNPNQTKDYAYKQAVLQLGIQEEHGAVIIYDVDHMCELVIDAITKIPNYQLRVYDPVEHVWFNKEGVASIIEDAKKALEEEEEKYKPYYD